jgi:hypothetical protein
MAQEVTHIPSDVVIIIDNDNREVMESIGRHQVTWYDDKRSSRLFEATKNVKSSSTRLPVIAEFVDVLMRPVSRLVEVASWEGRS